jgi:hypothetical protein
MALSAEQILVIRNYVTELQRTNPNNWVNDLAAAMDQFDVSPSMLQEAYSDISVSQIQDTYNQSRPSGKFSTARPQDVGPPSPTTTAPPPPPQEKITIRPEAIQNIEQPVQSSQQRKTQRLLRYNLNQLVRLTILKNSFVPNTMLLSHNCQSLNTGLKTA